MDLTSIKLMILDVDGVLTDGRLAAASDGSWGKSFYVQDGCAIKLWRRCGGKVAFLSGRSEPVVKQRADELGIDFVELGASDKRKAYDAILSSAGLDGDAVAYVGDDFPDVGPMRRVAFPVAVANAHPAVKRESMYVTRRPGGSGAVAEVIEFLLRKQRRWSRDLLIEC